MLNSGKKWTSYGINRLIDMSIEGASHHEIARIMGRTTKAVERKKHNMKRTIVKNMGFAPLMYVMRAGFLSLDI